MGHDIIVGVIFGDWLVNSLQTEKVISMTIYSYICETCGHKQEEARGMNDDELPVLCNKCAFVMRRDFQADFGKHQPCSTWPMESYAAGVHPKQVPEMRAIDKKHGVPTDYTSDGDPVFRGPAHRRRYCEAHGLYDRNAGLSDPVPASCR